MFWYYVENVLVSSMVIMITMHLFIMIPKIILSTIPIYLQNCHYLHHPPCLMVVRVSKWEAKTTQLTFSQPSTISIITFTMRKMKMMMRSMRMTGIFPLQKGRGKMKLAQMSMDIGIADLALLDHMRVNRFCLFFGWDFLLPIFLSFLCIITKHRQGQKVTNFILLIRWFL